MSAVRVVDLRMTCGACPSQWEGATDDGRHVYIRYRWGRLTCGVGDSLADAVGNVIWTGRVGDQLDGVMGDCGRPATFEAEIYDGRNPEPVIAPYCESCADVLAQGGDNVRPLTVADEVMAHVQTYGERIRALEAALRQLCDEIDVAVDECDINRAAEARNEARCALRDQGR